MDTFKLDWSSVATVCEFDYSAKNVFTRYIVNQQEWVFKPCFEFGLSYVNHLFLLFCTILAHFQVARTSRIPSELVRIILTYRLFVVFSTAIILLVYLVLGLFSSITLPSILIVEYGFVAVTWLVYSIVWILAIEHNTWPRPPSLIVAYNLSLLTLFLITYQRVKHFGYWDAHCFGVAFIVLCHTVNFLFQFMEWHTARNLQAFQQLVETDESVDLPESGDEGAGFFSALFFCWVNPLILRGYKGQLRNVENLLRLPPSLRVATIENDFFGNSPNEYVDNQEFSFTIGLLRTFGLRYFSLAILRFLADSLTFSGPILLHLLVVCLQTGDPENMGFIYATLMLVLSFSAALCDFNFNFYMQKIALKVRAAILVALYDKLLQLPQHQLSNFSSGQLINFMSTDIDRIVSFVTSFHAAWSMPFNIIIALYLLYREVGLAFLSGLFCAILMIPLNRYVATKIGQMSVKLMSFKDQRLKLVTEIIRAIRTVKVSNWEPYFEKRINELRQQELKYLKRRKYLDAICVYLWASAPLLIIIAILTTYTVVLEEKLTPAKVFTSLALVNILIMPLNAFPWVLNSLVEAYVSKRRLDKFFRLKSILPNFIYSLTDSADHLLVLDEAQFAWPTGFDVGSISFTGTRSMIIGVAGSVGSGKSTTLLGILGEAVVLQDEQHLISGIPAKTTIRIRQMTIHEGFAYVGQESWVRRGTIRDNILCGSRMNEAFYRRVLDATALSRDIELMPGKDQYTIADDGSTLSGGQRARLALARAIYQENDIYILDDLFASLDRKVGRFVWKNAIEGILRANGRLVLVATHNSDFLRQTDLIVQLNPSGHVQGVGRADDFFKQKRDFGQVDELNQIETMDIAEPIAYSESSMGSSFPPFDAVEHVQEVTPDEQMERGTVKTDIYWFYARAVGFGLAALIGASLLAMQASKNLSDAWLSKWTINSTNDHNNSYESNFLYGPRQVLDLEDDADKANTRYYLTVFVSLAGINTIFTLCRAFLFAYGGVVAAKNLHSSLLKRVLRSSISFWDSTPWGRVVNRLCADVYLADDSLPFQLNIFLATVVNLSGALILSVVALPFLLVAISLLFVLYYLIQRYYRHTTCEVKRLTSLTLSPLYGHITDSVAGLVTIRAFRFMPRFMEKLRQLLEDNLRAQYTNIAASQWLSVRLQLLGILMVSSIAFTAVVESKFFHVESGLIALSITYALTLTGLLNNILSSFIETEKELVSVERIADYIHNIPTEETNHEVENVDRFLFCRNAVGQIDFTCVSMRYAPNLPFALTNVTFHLDAGQRGAIIGRTGAGKSSIFQALLRAYPIESGKIFIDSTIDLYKLDPKAIRSMFGVITQTPFLFSGSIRENLCMDNEQISDDQINAVLFQAGLGNWLERLGGLDAEILEAGANLSFGEKQIICVCRLVLSRPKIVLIDEATAHMDEATHMTMNNLVRSVLPTATVISIVHRLTGLHEYDWIIEMSNGNIVKQGPPQLFIGGAGPSGSKI